MGGRVWGTHVLKRGIVTRTLYLGSALRLEIHLFFKLSFKLRTKVFYLLHPTPHTPHPSLCKDVSIEPAPSQNAELLDLTRLPILGEYR